jgi:large subunit ribosomal protein L28
MSRDLLLTPKKCKISSNPAKKEDCKMAKICEICGKKPVYGHNVSHSHKMTNRRWEPNLQKVKVVVKGNNQSLRVCTACIRSGKIQKAV